MPAPPLFPPWLAPFWKIRLAQVFLVLLRLAIGWHLFVQGLDKIVSVQLGPTETNQPWTSRGYLQEAQGPLASVFRQLAGDPELLDQDFLRLPVSSDLQGETLTPPARLMLIWDQYQQRFAQERRLRKDKPNESPGWRLLDAIKEQHKRAFIATRRPMVKQFPTGPVTVELSLAEQIQYYQRLRQELRQIQDQEFSLFGTSGRQKRWAELKAETLRLRPLLLREIAAASAALEAAFELAANCLTVERLVTGTFAGQAQPQGAFGALVGELPGGALFPFQPKYDEDRKYQPLASSIPQSVAPSRSLPLVDGIMRWGLFLAGLGLLLGLLTPGACLVGALLLLLIFLAQPPLPWLPVPQPQGFTPFLNATLIEALALLALAWVPTGRWLGLDALWPWVWRLRKSRSASAVEAVSVPVAVPPVGKGPGTGKYRRYTGA